MASACRDILGKAEDIHLLANTGQDWYDAFKQSAKNLRHQNGDDYMEKNMPGSWLLLQMLDAPVNSSSNSANILNRLHSLEQEEPRRIEDD